MSEAGEKVFSTSGRNPQRSKFVVPKPGTYDLKLRGASVAIACKDEPNSVPYIKVTLEALGSGTDGGPNGLVFHRLFLSTEPTSSGFVMTEKGGQIVDMARGLGEDLNLPLKTHTAKVRIGGSKENPEYTVKDIDIISPEAVKQLLMSKDGAILRGRIRNIKGLNGEQQAEVANFEDAEGKSPF